jgi:hydrogenase maturation protein HypF
VPDKKTVRIKIWGIVQGVGFRPFVAKLADRLGMKGEVLNIGGLVDVVLTDTPARIQSFLEALKKEKPLPAEIVHIKTEDMAHREFSSFTILDSDEGDDEAAMIPADLSICPDCLAELQDQENPRYLHPFISCMVCGPRYTIIDKIPYDRENTAMVEFPMCDFCKGEYTDRQDRRYHAQTISCHDCGPMIESRLSEKKDCCSEASAYGVIGIDAPEKILENALMPVIMAASFIGNGRIVALKGVGGYNFICSPFREDAVLSLRRLKIREEKPFAVMFRDMVQIRSYCHVSDEEEELLRSNAKPIVLLERRTESDGRAAAGMTLPGDKHENEIEELPLICGEVFKTSRYIGAFLPSMGVQHMLIDFAGPLVVTSANLSDMPIIKDDEEMFRLQDALDFEHDGSKILEAVFYNERKIRIRLDDSVARIIDGQPQMIRRSKGYAPVPLYINNRLTKSDMILATGGQLKASFSLSKGPFAYVSQYFGDLDSMEMAELYKKNVSRMSELFRIRPTLVVSDLHPLYYTTSFAQDYAKENGAELLMVQHHHAHVASVMAEHDLQGSVLGVSFDGTGYGTDGTIWGGEFLICKDDAFSRAGHLEPIKMLGGDSSMKEGWKSAFSYLYHYIDDGGRLATQMKEPEDPRWPTVKAGLAYDINTIRSSSMGRLFDGIAALTGIHDTNRYEGECAVMLENAAAEALKAGMQEWNLNFGIEDQDDGIIISARALFMRIQEALDRDIKPEQIALGFHYAVADMILEVAKHIREREQIDTIALTGGVFQNKILMERTLALLRSDGFRPYYNISVGPNDGGICLGQNYIGMKYLTGKKHNDNIELESSIRKGEN